ncbi:hypothetical protein [Kribbella lupini]
MRTAAELKSKWLGEIPLVLERTGMWVRSGEEAETLFRRLVEDLCFLDERDPAPMLDDDRLRYGSQGVLGGFRRLFGRDGRYVAEVASVYAEYLHRLGYLEVELVDWQLLAQAARAGLRELGREEVEAAYGRPSLLIDSRIGCYVSADGWLYVDYVGEPAEQLRLVRSVRVSAESFDGGVFLTPYGKWLVGGGL